MKELLEQIAKKYRGDRIAPGVMVSYLMDKQLFYVAVHRFPGTLRSRRIIASAQGPNYEKTVLAVQKLVSDENDHRMAPQDIHRGIGLNKKRGRKTGNEI